MRNKRSRAALTDCTEHSQTAEASQLDWSLTQEKEPETAAFSSSRQTLTLHTSDSLYALGFSSSQSWRKMFAINLTELKVSFPSENTALLNIVQNWTRIRMIKHYNCWIWLSLYKMQNNYRVHAKKKIMAILIFEAFTYAECLTVHTWVHLDTLNPAGVWEHTHISLHISLSSNLQSSSITEYFICVLILKRLSLHIKMHYFFSTGAFLFLPKQLIYLTLIRVQELHK